MTRQHAGRRGFGTIFFVAMSILSILIIIVGVRQFGSMGGATRDTTSAIEVGRKANLLVESAVEEGTARALLEDVNVNGDPPADPKKLYRRIRQFAPGMPVNAVDAPVRSSRKFQDQVAFVEATRTYDLYRQQADVRLTREDREVYYGMHDQSGIPGYYAESNESRGVMAFIHGATAKASGIFRNVDRVVEFEKSFKVVLMAPPWPLTPYSLYIRNEPAPGAGFLPNPASVFNVHDFLRKCHDDLKEVWQIIASSLPDEAKTFPVFPLTGPTQPVFVRTNNPSDFLQTLVAEANARNVKQLYTQQTGAVTDQSIANWLAQLKARYQKVKEDFTFNDAEKARFAPEKNPYSVIHAQAWENKATYKVNDIAGLQAATLHPDKTNVLFFKGVYYVRDSITLEHNWEGRGIIFVEGKDAVAGKAAVKIKRIRKDGGPRNYLLIVTEKDIDIKNSAGDDDIDADLMAPNGTVFGLEEGKRVKGSVMINYLLKWPSFPDPPALKIERAPGRENYAPWKAGDAPMASPNLQLLHVFFDPGFLTKEYSSRRDGEN